jgi:hypothetical protein
MDLSNTIENDFMKNVVGDYIFHVDVEEEIFNTVSTSILKPKKYVSLLVISMSF